MSAASRPSSRDEAVERMFGAPLAELYVMAARSGASPSLGRALELRSYLAVSEEHLNRVCDRIHASTAPGDGRRELSPGSLRIDADWLEAALDGRSGCLKAMDTLLAAMPPPAARSRSAPTSSLPAAPRPAPAQPAAARGR
ncbi:hypothetical protein ACFVP0_27765 [Streptomyces cinereoruber]|uniref:hypothetical protein n=1 Tax=Streptomyces cinereoruber TaxID=67260 RepID=UPI0036821442